VKWQKVWKYAANDLNWQPKHHKDNAAKYNHRCKEATSVAVNWQVDHLATNTNYH